MQIIFLPAASSGRLALPAGRRRGHRHLPVLALCLAAAPTATPAHALDRIWTGSGDGTSFDFGLNWSGGLVPGPLDLATFDVIGGSVTSGADRTTMQLGINSTAVTLDLGATTYTVAGGMWVGERIGDVASLTLAGGTLSVQDTLFVDDAFVGLDPGTSGRLTVSSGAAFTTPGSLVIGDGGAGVLDLQAGGTMTTNLCFIADDPASSGQATVDGATASWTLADALIVGNFGNGTLSVVNGASISAASVIVGDDAEGTGDATVNGASINSTISVTVGNEGIGTLGVIGGGSLTAPSAFVGDELLSNGTLEIVGPGASWTAAVEARIGNDGTGGLSVLGGASGSSGNAVIGAGLGSDGDFTVSGPGSTWTNTGQLSLGNMGTGSVGIFNGGSASCGGLAFFGDDPGSDGSLLVSGTGTSWSCASEAFIGNFGSGSMTVTNGATVSTTRVKIGDEIGATGGVIVNNPGSTWTDTVEIFVGNFGTGTLTVWSSTQSLTVGDLGSGSLTISAGGAVDAASVAIGLGLGSSGTVNVNGAGSTLSTTGNVQVGGAGQGSLSVAEGQVTAGGSYTQNPAASLSVVLGPQSGTCISAAGTASVAGSLTVSLAAGFTPPPGSSYEIITASSVSGTFAAVTMPAGISVVYEADRVLVQVEGTPMIPGDINGDGVVDVDDLTAVILAWGVCPAPCAADIDGNGVVDVDDLTQVILSWT
jgi:T5SS/PEP-CTERM-associated repeat protein